ncbi:MAG: HD domain-containing protein [Candidatus Gracilibacteria bacterium]|nr:HD domain-containing protein [Candidatus Gracilibacteria bacterium]
MNLLSRDEELSKVFRYKGSPCTPMYYRPNLKIHSKRVEWIAFEVADFLMKNSEINIDIDLVREMARFHDDAEIITGDFLAMDKEKFSESKLKEYEKDCENAIDILYENYKNISEKNDYKEILLKVENKDGIEFQIVDFADKLDSHLEITHELFAGNEMFAIILSKWGLEVGPFDYTKNKVRKIVENILDYFGNNIDVSDTFLDMNSDFNDMNCLDNSRTHNLNSLSENTGYNLYDKWIKLHFNYGGEDDINYLTNQLEFRK